MVWMEIAFWTLVVGFCVFVVGLLAWRLGELYGRSGVGWVKRMTKSDDILRCRMCGAEHTVERHHRGTDTCGHPSCVRLVLAGRARMAEAREVAGVHLMPKVIPATRQDGSEVFTSSGQPVMVRDPSGEWVQVPGPGGLPSQLSQDAVALQWFRDEHGA